MKKRKKEREREGKKEKKHEKKKGEKGKVKRKVSEKIKEGEEEEHDRGVKTKVKRHLFCGSEKSKAWSIHLTEGKKKLDLKELSSRNIYFYKYQHIYQL